MMRPRASLCRLAGLGGNGSHGRSTRRAGDAGFVGTFKRFQPPRRYVRWRVFEGFDTSVLGDEQQVKADSLAASA